MIKGLKKKDWKHTLTERDIENRTAVCKTDGKVRIIKTHKNRPLWSCAVAVAQRMGKTRYIGTENIILKKFCEICGSKGKIVLDHNHKSGKYRGSLCHKCNVGIGLLMEDPLIFKSALKYLKRNLQ